MLRSICPRRNGLSQERDKPLLELKKEIILNVLWAMIGNDCVPPSYGNTDATFEFNQYCITRTEGRGEFLFKVVSYRDFPSAYKGIIKLTTVRVIVIVPLL